MKVFISQIKPTLGNVTKNLDMMVESIEKQIEAKSDIIVFPELSLTGYLLEDMVYDVAIEKVPEKLLELSKKISIIFGAVELGEDLYHYNTAFYLEDGEVKHRHRKVYLPTYGMFDEGRYFKSGDKIRAFDTKFGRVGMLICEDIFHSTSSYILSEDGAFVVFAIANSPTKFSYEGLQIEKCWEALCQASATTNNNYVVMVNRVGVEDGVNFWGGSFVVAPNGSIVEKLEKFDVDGKVVEIEKREVVKARFGLGTTKDNKLDLVLSELTRIKNK